VQVETIVAQAIAEAQHAGLAATIAVVDRVGNVLAIYEMTGSAATTTIGRAGVPNQPTGLDGEAVDAKLAAISKAGTGAYLSSQGSAFSTRTASQIVQEHFNPGELGAAGGPFFGVQFSQLPCGDFVQRAGADALEGPKRLPLGISADPGGLPLYLDGVPVGGIGVELDGTYALDPNIFDIDNAPEELIAVAGAAGFAAPSNRRADQISVADRFLRFTDSEAIQSVDPGAKSVPPGAGALVDVPGFYDGVDFLDAALFLTSASGVVATHIGGFRAEILIDSMGMTPRFPPSNSVTPATALGGLAAPEVLQLLTSALDVAERARAEIRKPVDSAARVNIAVVDLGGNVLGFARSPDAPVFGMDVSVQKARTAAFFSDPDAAAALSAAAAPSFDSARAAVEYLADLRVFLADVTALANGTAFSNRAVGELSRPFFPDGVDGMLSGPLSRRLVQWSPFSTGLQLDLVVDALAAVVFDGENPLSCSDAALAALAGGIQISPGSVPIYRGAQLVGGIGISGDGDEQDDLVAFLGLHEAGLALAEAINNADAMIRSDTLSAKGSALSYVVCPAMPFLDSAAQNVCDRL
jgi:uncharacterized protein GlcG (DUF336 family)